MPACPASNVRARLLPRHLRGRAGSGAARVRCWGPAAGRARARWAAHSRPSSVAPSLESSV